jgi:hypothetical protein
VRLLPLLVLLPFLSLYAQKPDCGLLAGWQQHGPDRTYEADTLFEYMDGNAEGYIIYGYKKLQGVQGVTCQKDGDRVLIDVHEMAGSEAAWGIFAAIRAMDQPVEAIGTVGQVSTRKAAFVKDRYLVELAAESDTDHAALLRQTALAMEKRIAGSTALPSEVAWFPPGRQSLRLVPESVLGIRILKRGFVAQYTAGKAFLVPEASPEAAAATLGKLKARFGDTSPVTVGQEGLTAKDKYLGELAVFRKGRYVGGYANVPDGRDAVSLATALAANVP